MATWRGTAWEKAWERARRRQSKPLEGRKATKGDWKRLQEENELPSLGTLAVYSNSHESKYLRTLLQKLFRKHPIQMLSAVFLTAWIQCNLIWKSKWSHLPKHFALDSSIAFAFQRSVQSYNLAFSFRANESASRLVKQTKTNPWIQVLLCNEEV